MKKAKILAVILSLAMLIGLLTGCGSTSSTSDSDSEADAAATTEETGEETAAEETEDSGSSITSGAEDVEIAEGDYSDVKVALMLSGSANDGGWSQMAYDAAMAIEADYSCTVNYTESIPTTDYESVMRGYADAGYDIIIAHGAEFLDTTILVAADYPDVTFINNSAMEESMTGAPDNVIGIDYGTYQLGYVAGVICGFASENGMIGAIGSNEISSIVGWVEGVEDGAQLVNADAQVISAYTGSYDDQVKAKQCTDSLVEQGCDVITQNADACGTGAVEECDELGVMNVGNVADMTGDGESCLVSVVQDSQQGLEIAIADTLTGTITGGWYDYGPVSNVTRLSDYSGIYADVLTDDEKAIVNNLLDALHEGIEINTLTLEELAG